MKSHDGLLQKATAYGTITYTYDAENRLQKTCGDTGVGVEYQYGSIWFAYVNFSSQVILG